MYSLFLFHRFSIGKMLLHVMNAEVVITWFGHYTKIASASIKAQGTAQCCSLGLYARPHMRSCAGECALSTTVSSYLCEPSSRKCCYSLTL